MKASFRLSTNVTLALLIGLLALAGQWSSYRLSAQSLEAAVREREIDKVKAVGTAIKAAIQAYGDKAKLIAQIKASDSVLAQAMTLDGPERTARLALELDEVFEIGELQVLEVTDTQERVVYRAQDPGRTGDQATGWGVAEALSGVDTLVSSRGPEGVSIRNISPMRVGGAIVGTISAGVGLNHQTFIDRVSLQVGAKLALLGRQGELLAGQAELALAERDDGAALTEAFQTKLPVYRSDALAHYTRVYLPLTIVDDGYVVVAQIDSTDAYALIAAGTRRSAIYAILILMGSLLIGFVALRVALSPLRQLRRRAEQTALALGQTIHAHGSDEVASVVKVLDTLTNRLVQRNNELLVAKNQADTTSRAKSQFLSAMSHEIRTPMNGVIGMIDVLQQSSLKGHQVEMVDTIRDSAFALLAIIDDILDFSKIEAGKLEIEQVPTSVAEVVEKACVMLDYLALKKNVELTLFTDPALPEQVFGDPQRLRQIVINLVNNAIKFSGGQARLGRVSVRAVLAAREAGQFAVDIHVTDNGIGMDAATQASLFNPFTQGDVSTTRRFGGTGLGLSIAHNLAELMGGDISVQSTPGQGSTFTLHLPCVPVAETPGSASEEHPLLAGLSCLAVGGADGLADDLAAYLAAAGARVERAPDLAAAGAHSGPTAPGPWVWLIDAGSAPPALDALRVLIDAHTAQHLNCVIVVGRGKRRLPRRQGTDQRVFEIDANVLTRQSVENAVNIAAGLRSAKVEAPPTGKSAARLAAPPRADALRQGRLILVAEDNETNQKVIVQQLALLGYAADIADDGSEALKRWLSGDYALLLTDLHMPAMDGYELTAAIRDHEAGQRRIPIIALTANALKGEAEHCRAVGMDDYLSKPAQLVDLGAMLAKWLPTTAAVMPELTDMATAATPDDETHHSSPFKGEAGRGLAHGTLPHPLLNPPLEGEGDDSFKLRVGTGKTASLDVSVLAALVGDDPQTICEFLEDFRASAATIAAELQTACAAGDAARAGAQAHKLKSSAGAVGALALGGLCAEMEAAGKAGDTAMLKKIILKFVDEMTAVDAALETLTSRHKNNDDREE